VEGIRSKGGQPVAPDGLGVVSVTVLVAPPQPEASTVATMAPPTNAFARREGRIERLKGNVDVAITCESGDD